MPLITRALLISFLLALTLTSEGLSGAATFLDDTAGMSAYFQFTPPTPLDSNLLRNQFRVVEVTTSDYLLGSVPCAGFEADTLMDAKVLVHNDGWVVAYFPKSRPVSQIVYLPMDTETRLDLVLKKIAFAMGVDTYTTAYTHFQHQDASTLLRIGRMRDGVNGESEMDIRLPGENSYHDRAWHLRAESSWASTWFNLDQLTMGTTKYVSAGTIPADRLVAVAKHIVGIGINVAQFGYAYGELDLAYSGSTGLSITGADWSYSMPLQPAPQGLIDAAADLPRYFDSYLPMIVR